MSKQRLINISNANNRLVKNGVVLVPQTILVNYDQRKLVLNQIDVQTIVTFETMKTDECAIFYHKHMGSKNVTIMNFANRHTPGGGYCNGAKAQEEDLCRTIPGLYASLRKAQYPFPSDTVLITPDIEIMRYGETYNLLPSDDVHKVNVASVAAQNLNHERFDEPCVRRTLENMYCAIKSYLPSTDTLILGAWGCGAFKNNPNTMATIMNDINLKYGGHYTRIVFSVPKGGNNEPVFRDIIQIS